MALVKALLSIVGLGLTFGLAGCGGGGQSSTTPPPLPISIAFGAPPPATLAGNAYVSISATVTNGATSSVLWSVTCGSAGACGSFDPTRTGSGYATVYTAPAAIPSGTTVTITATSTEDTTKSVSATVTITTAQPVVPISVSFEGTVPTYMRTGTQTNLSVTINNDPNPTALVTWTLTCSGIDSCGRIFSALTDGNSPIWSGSNQPVTYYAPASAAGPITAVVTATSNDDPTKSASATITILPPLAVTLGSTPGYLQVNTTALLSAAISNDNSANPEVTWAATCGATQCGSFSSATTGNAIATTYTAPAAVPPGNTVTVSATSVADPTKSSSATITITNNPTPPALTLANGSYVFQIASGSWLNAGLTTGTFYAMDGNIIGGEQDSVFYGEGEDMDGAATYSPGHFFNRILGGSYTATDGNVQITLYLGSQAVNGYETLNGTLVSSSKGTAIQLMGNGLSVEPQTSVAAPSGGYAISMFGGDQYGNAAWMGGVLNIDSPGGISGAGSELDIGGATISAQAGSVGTPDQYGRVEIQLNSTASAPLPASNLFGYMVDATHIRLISAAIDGSGTVDEGVMAGLALGQGASAGKFSSSSVAGSSYVFGLGSEATAGVFTANANGTVSGEINPYNVSTSSPLPLTGSWTVDPTGRLILSNLSFGSTSGDSMNLYLSGDGNALIFLNDTTSVAGSAFQRQAGPYTAATFSGNYVMSSIEGYGWWLNSSASGGADPVTGFSYLDSSAQETPFAGSFTPAADGVYAGSIAGYGNFNLYIVDNTRAVLIPTSGSSNDGVWGVLQLQQ